MWSNFMAFNLFHVIGTMMFGALLFLVFLEALTNMQLWLERRRLRREGELEELPAGSFHLDEAGGSLRRLVFHRIPARTISWTGSQLVGRPPRRRELHIGR